MDTYQRNIKIDGEVAYSKQFTDIAEADEWLAKMRAKQDGDFLPSDHTVEDIENPEIAKAQSLATAFAALDNKMQDFLRLYDPSLKDL